MIQHIIIILSLGVFGGCKPLQKEQNDKTVVSNTIMAANTKVALMTLYDLPGMIDMTQNRTTFFYITDETDIKKVKEEVNANGNVVKSDTVNTVAADEYSAKKPVTMVPEKYLQGKAMQTFGAPNAADDGGWGITATSTDGKQISLLFDNNEQSVPADLKDLFNLYTILKEKM